jgi:cysteinyl-tRNA synthetase
MASFFRQRYTSAIVAAGQHVFDRASLAALRHHTHHTMALKIYNTLSRSVETFVPLESGKVSMYTCGITVYDLCHIGHARSAIAFDVIQRWLRASGYAVNYVKNITDIEDKIIARAVKNGETIRQLTDRMIAEMYRDFDALGIQRPDHDPRATDYVPQMLSIVGALEKNGLAYRAPSGDVNYAVRKFPGYGKLSGKSLDELHAGERVAVLDGKDDPLDFVLWKSAKAEEPPEAKWESAYGAGRPGWHIECSAMACALLGEQFDIHGGGADLQFPHHENEIAQSEGAFGKSMATYWVHNGFVNIDNEKMSKSLGNFFTIRDVLKKFDAEIIRFFLVRSHYRSGLNYSDVHLEDARASLKRLYTALDLVAPHADSMPATIDFGHTYAARFQAAMNNDFATPEAVAVLFDLAAEVNRSKSADLAMLLKQLGGLLGILQGDPKAFLQSGSVLDDAAIQQKIAERAAAKAAKNFAAADQIRKDLASQGIVLKDSPQGTSWEAATA